MDTLENIPIKLIDPIHDYKLFVDNQVLTANQLNTMLRYLDQQHRLTRTKMFGVGIMCGLSPTIEGATIVVSKGCGITSDGDLLSLEEDRIFTHFRLFEDEHVNYDAWERENGPDENLFRLELLTEEDDAPGKLPLEDYESEIQGLIPNTDLELGLNNMVCIFYQEAYLDLEEDCADGDCDNLGPDQRQTPRVLLIHQAFLDTYTDCINSYQLNPVSVRKANLNDEIESQGVFNRAYVTAIQNSIPDLQEELAKTYPLFSHLLDGLYQGGDPYPNAWQNALSRLEDVDTDVERIQYYYDFLRDLVDAYNEYADAVFELCPVCSPSPTSFPKHLMLGEMPPEGIAGNHNYRHHFQANPQINFGDLRVKIVRRLHRRLDLMIRSFAPDLVIGQNRRDIIRITPSKQPLASLSERPIPIYYRNQEALRNFWNPKRGIKGQGRYSYGYHSEFGRNNLGELTHDCDGVDFFRVEGHIGQERDFVQRLMERMELPFSIEFVELGDDVRNIRPIAPFFFPELDILHRLKRNELWEAFDKTEKYTQILVEEARPDDSRWNVDIPLDVNVATPINLKATIQQEFDSEPLDPLNLPFKTQVQNVKLALQKPSKNFDYQSFNQIFRETQQKSGILNQQFKRGVQASSFTPFEGITATTSPSILGSVDKWIKGKEARVSEQYLFKNMVNDHEALAHIAGVRRGGTFIMLTVDDTVVADFYLPYPFTPNLNIEEEEDDVFEIPEQERPTLPWASLHDALVIPDFTPYGLNPKIDNTLILNGNLIEEQITTATSGILSNFATFSTDINQKIQGFDTRIQGFDGRITGFDNRIQGVDSKIQGFDSLVQGFDGRISEVTANVQGLQQTVPVQIEAGVERANAVALSNREFIVGWGVRNGVEGSGFQGRLFQGEELFNNNPLTSGLDRMGARVNVLIDKGDAITSQEQRELKILTENIDSRVKGILDLYGSRDSDLSINSEEIDIMRGTANFVNGVSNKVELSNSRETAVNLQRDPKKAILLNVIETMNFGRTAGR